MEPTGSHKLRAALPPAGLPLEQLGDRARVDGRDQRVAQQGVSVPISADSHYGKGGVHVVTGSPEFDPGAEPQPVGTGPALVGHSDRAGIDDPPPLDATVELSMRVATHNHRRVDSLSSRPPALLWRECGQHLVVVAWGGMTEKDRPESVDLERRVRGERPDAEQRSMHPRGRTAR